MSKKMEVSEAVFMAVDCVLQRFHCSDEKEVKFPTSLSGTERAFIHHVARTRGYRSKSQGKGFHRFVTVRKKEDSDAAASIFPLAISHSSLLVVGGLLQRFPCSKRECSDMQLCSGSSYVAPEHGWANILSSGVASVPLKRTRSELDGFRRSLPVYKQQEEVVQLIRHNKVVLVVGRAGSGKTTQVPQFLLDDCNARGEPCRIFCIQPRRLAAVAAAERVAAERGEIVGQTSAYQVELETRLCSMSVLIFCTSWVFVRSLMDGDDTLASATHIIMDEVEERDGLTDLLLIKLRDVLPKLPGLKLIVSGAALDVGLFTRYLGSCPVIQLTEQQFQVTELFLEDALRGRGCHGQDQSKSTEEASLC